MKLKLIKFPKMATSKDLTLGKVYNCSKPYPIDCNGYYNVIDDAGDVHEVEEECLESLEKPQESTKQYVLVSRMGYKDYVGTLEEILEYASDNNVDILQERVFELGEEVKLKVVVEDGERC